jgi:predicted alpha-1,2-mannosidase
MIRINVLVLILLLLVFSGRESEGQKQPVDYVNPYMGNISHMLVPTFPMVHLPNGMLRIKPERNSYVESYIHGLPVFTPSHRGGSVFRISPYSGNAGGLHPIVRYSYDNEKVKPYLYEVYLDEQEVEVDLVPSFKSAIYRLNFLRDTGNFIVFHSGNGSLNYDDGAISGYQDMGQSTKVYWYLETNTPPSEVGYLKNGRAVFSQKNKVRKEDNIVLDFGQTSCEVSLRYGISFISVKQARENLEKEIENFDLETLARKGRETWNKKLGQIEVKGGTEDQKSVFYTSLYRTYERMINISEDGRYWSGMDKKVHHDEGTPFYVDDWVWDSYLTHHPLRTLLDPDQQEHVLSSYVRMSEQNKEGWMPTFPEVHHDSHRMNGNHAVAVFADALNKGLDFDVAKAYASCKRSIMEETHAPWTRREAGEFDQFYKDHGYFPALKEGEREFLNGIHGGERRQSVAVTLGAVYDDFCLALLADELGYETDYSYFHDRSFNYRNLFHPETRFFHPKDHDGNFLESFDYKLSGGLGARDYYDENNGWTFRWDLKHNVKDLIDLMGGEDPFCHNLDQLFSEGLGAVKWEFWNQLPDQTGNVGQFSMGNEPSFHIPYLYNYAGKPWKTQKRIRSLLEQWFRNDLMGIPGDEDGGAMSAFVVFSSMGLYPVTPGIAQYNIGSPVFEEVVIHLDNGKDFKIVAKGANRDNKYIQKASLNGKSFNRTWLNHRELIDGGTLFLEMGDKANKSWGISSEARPFSLSDKAALKNTN